LPIGLEDMKLLSNKDMGRGSTCLYNSIKEIKIEGQAAIALRYAKQKKYQSVEDYYDQFLRLCEVILQQPNDIYLRKAFREGIRTKVKMAIISMPRGTLAKVAEFAILVEKKLLMK
jgi:hypothetical protein